MHFKIEQSNLSHEIIAIFIGRYYFTSIFEKRNVIKNFYLYHVVQTTKVKDRHLRRSLREELSYTAHKGMSSLAFDFSFHSFKPRDPKHSLFSPTATVSCVSKKNSLPVSVVQFFLNVNIQSSSF